MRPALADTDRELVRQQLLERARQQYQAANYEDALLSLQEAYQIKPAPALLLTMGNAHLLLVEPDKALERFRQYRERTPRPRPEVMKDLERGELTARSMERAQRLSSENKFAESAEVFVRECRPDEIPRVFLRIAEARRKQGDLRAARTAYKQFLVGEPQAPAGLRRQAQEAIAQINQINTRGAPNPNPNPDPGPHPEKPWYRRPFIWGVAGGAAALGIIVVAAGVCGRPGGCSGAPTDPPGLQVDQVDFRMIRIDLIQFK